MDTESKHAVKFVTALARSKRQFVEFAQQFRNQPDVVRVLHSLECIEYQSHISIEGYIDAEFHNGKTIAWWLEINWDSDQWNIESRVLLNDAQGQDVQEVVRDFPVRTAQTLDECVEQLAQAISDLVNSAERTVNSLRIYP